MHSQVVHVNSTVRRGLARIRSIVLLRVCHPPQPPAPVKRVVARRQTHTQDSMVLQAAVPVACRRTGASQYYLYRNHIVRSTVASSRGVMNFVTDDVSRIIGLLGITSLRAYIRPASIHGPDAGFLLCQAAYRRCSEAPHVRRSRHSAGER